jgi:hypothetical protein
LRQSAGAQSGSYVWDVTDLAPGAYYVYAMIYDVKGVGKAYAAGAVVIPNPKQSGKIVVIAGNHMVTSENGKQTAFVVRLANAPSSDVIVPVSSTSPREGVAMPASLTFTPKNWMTTQTVTVTGQSDCAPDGSQVYQVLSGSAITVDPNYIGLSGAPVRITNQEGKPDFNRTTNSATIHICGLQVASERKAGALLWEYSLTAELTNTGANVAGVAAHLSKLPFGIQVTDDTMLFGAVNSGETAKSTKAVTVRARFPIPKEILQLGIGFKWNVTEQR